jgi:hypothetical protein
MARVRILASNNAIRQVGYKIVDLVVVCAVTAPDAISANIVKTEALRARYQRLQQALGRAYAFSCDQVVNFRSHWQPPPLVRSAFFIARTTMPCAPENGCDRGLSQVSWNGLNHKIQWPVAALLLRPLFTLA